MHAAAANAITTCIVMGRAVCVCSWLQYAPSLLAARHGCCGILLVPQSQQRKPSTPPTNSLQTLYPNWLALNTAQPTVPETCSYTCANKVLSALPSRKQKNCALDFLPLLIISYSSPTVKNHMYIVLRWLSQDAIQLFIE